ncbi:MAG: YfiR family protein [Holophaga sp.]|nr:YfiR family protein [Holophaga sp.]
MLPLLILPPALVAPAFTANLAMADPQSKPEYLVKAQIIRKLLDYLEWPMGESGQALVVAVMEPSPFGDYLPKELGNLVIKGRPLKVRFFRGISQLGQCDVLFIPETSEENLGSILAGLRGKPIITIGDTPGFASRGVIVNLAPVEGRTRLEINATALKSSGVTLSPQVMKSATIFK